MVSFFRSSPFRKALPASLGLVLALSSCSSTKPAADNASPALYQHALGQLDKKNYENAILELEPLMYSTRATDLEDDVLYSLGTAYFQSKQYLLASEMYRRILQQTPGSPYVKSAQYQLARSYERLSPSYELDQEYTVRAINEFRIYLELYPEQDVAGASRDVETYRELLKLKPDNAEYKEKYEEASARLAAESPARYARTAIPALREKLAHNRFSIASQYVQLKKYRAATIYFDQVIRLYPDTIWLDQAWMGKIEVAVKRQKWFEARQTIEQYLERYPDRKQQVDGLYNTVMKNFSTP